jgi:hypothetical protein
VQDFERIALPTWSDIEGGGEIAGLDARCDGGSEQQCDSWRYSVTVQPVAEYVPLADDPWLDVPEANQGPCYEQSFHDRLPDRIVLCTQERLDYPEGYSVNPTCYENVDPYYYTIHADGSVTVEFGATSISQQGTSGWAWTQLKLEWHTY